MSIKLIAQVWEIEELKGSELLVMLALADHANDEGVCWPSQERLAQRARISRRQTIRVLKKLKANGYFKVQEDGNGRGNLTHYRLTLKGDTMSQGSDTMSHKKGDTMSHNEEIKGDICDIKGDICDTDTIYEPSIEPSVEKDMSADADESTPTQPASDWKDFVGAFCWVCFGHMDVGTLTEEKKGQLLSECKKVWAKKFGVDDLRTWYQTIWCSDWRYQKDRNARPDPSYVRTSLPRIRGQTPNGFSESVPPPQHKMSSVEKNLAAVDRVFAKLDAEGIELEWATSESSL